MQDLDEKAIREQSESAYNQHCVTWRKHAKIHKTHKHIEKTFQEYEYYGMGRSALCVGNGSSFEENIETIKNYAFNVDVFACDKTLGHLIDHGIKPRYVMVCDANVSYEKYMEKWKDDLSETTAFINVCANPKWSANGNWKDICFFVNKDILESEKEFTEISTCKNDIAAATNVSNAMIVLLTQSDNDGRKNLFAYDKICTIGYDYSWKVGGNYYSFNKTGDGKTNYMRHVYGDNNNGDPCYSSNNLMFSARWLAKYVTTFQLPVVQCSKSSVLQIPYNGKLSDQLKYRFKPEDSRIVVELMKKRAEILKIKKRVEDNINSIGREHWSKFEASIGG